MQWIIEKCKMNNTLLLSLAASVIPVLAIVFVLLLLLYKVYVKIRSKFNINVNCWFCNQNTKVRYLEANSWTCPHCEQYNGFTKDGDYNREILQQFDCSNGSKLNYSSDSSTLFASGLAQPRNGFCKVCNEAQRLKVEKLAQFEPKNETHFDEELKAYKAQLEDQYRLCATCDRHLNKVLREKKKMVLGSKFLDFIIKGAETLKQPHFNELRHAQQQQWKRRLTLHITILAIINLCCLCNSLPELTRERCTQYFGELIGHQLFVGISHVLALGRVLATYLELAASNAIVGKVLLFLRTLFMMMMYTLGLKLPQIARISFSTLFVQSCPFALLGLAFGYNVVDRFKLTRFTLLLVVWSTFAGGLIGEQLMLSQNTLMLITSLITILLTLSSKVESSPKLHDTSAKSFHKIYSEDYLSDEDTLSMLSQQFDTSSATTTNRSFVARSSSPVQTNGWRFMNSPQTTSRLSLGNVPRASLSPNASFQTCYGASSVCNFPNSVKSPITRAGSLYAGSNLDLSRSECAQNSFLDGTFKSAYTAADTSFGSAYSFTEPHPQHRCDESLFSSRNFPSSLSVGSGTAHQRATPFASYLLSPSRFSTTCLPSNASATSWLSGGYFNQHRSPMVSPFVQHMQHSKVGGPAFMHEHRNAMTTIDENISRASSQSSGFESQNSPLNVSRENSLGLDTSDMLLRTKSLENSLAFQPIEKHNRAYTPRPSLLSNPQLAQPLSVNCSSPTPSDVWKPPTSNARRRNGINSRSSVDSFNLRKINEELPAIKRGDLLRKWKSGQATS